MIAYLRGEQGDDFFIHVVDKMLTDPAHTCYAHVLNLKNDGLVIRRDASARLWQAAAQLKARGGVALPDCFFVALAQQVGGTVVTSDHTEFDPLVPLGICPIHFIR